MGDTKDVLLEITKVAETNPNYLDAKGILIATFSSAANTRELTDYFKLNGRSFLLFDLSKENAGYHIIKKPIHDGLFGFLESITDSDLKRKSEELIREVSLSSDTKNNLSQKSSQERTNKKITKTITEVKLTDADIDKMTKKEKEEMLNVLIDKGIENLTEYDKKIVQKLAV